MWFRVRHLIYTLFFLWVALAAWTYSSRMQRSPTFEPTSEVFAPVDSVIMRVTGGTRVYFEAPMKVRPPISEQESWWKEVLELDKPLPNGKPPQRETTIRNLTERKAKLDQDNQKREASEQKRMQDEANRKKIEYLEWKIGLLQNQKPDYAGLALNGISTFCAVLGIWLAWLTYRGKKASGPPPLPTR